MTSNADVVDFIFSRDTSPGEQYTFTIDDDNITIPCNVKYENEEAIVDAAMKTIIATGLDRNMIVYDADKPGLTKRLVALAHTVMRRNGSDARITAFLVDQKHEAQLKDMSTVFGSQIIFCDLARYSKFYTDSEGVHPPDRNSLMIAVDAPDDEVFVRIDSPHGTGIAVLNNKKVLLASG